MKKLINLMLGCSLAAVWYGCQKDDHANDYKNFFGGKEITYTSAVSSVIIQPGNLRVGLKWKASSDPSIVKYVVYYNNAVDSLVVNVSGKPDSIKAVVPKLAEYTYSFTIYSYDAKGNKSIPFEVNNARVYGANYQSLLSNREYNASAPYTFTDAGHLRLNFLLTDSTNVGTAIRYTNINGTPSEKILNKDSSAITIPDFKIGTPIIYNSFYRPERTAIDYFYAPRTNTFPTINSNIQCDKSLFREFPLPNDMGTYSDETKVRNLWNGSTTPQPYPNIFHSDDRATLPRTITFDMGRIYKRLTSIEEIGRNCCNNPDQFEVWGITDISNAATTLPSDNAGWKAEAIAKGWKLLKEVKRTDDGVAPYKTDFDASVPPARYIRIRILHNANGDTRNVNITQISFWANMLN
jgi:hypothetical protein